MGAKARGPSLPKWFQVCEVAKSDIPKLGGGNSNSFYFHPYLGKIPILTNIFQMG